jgi:restriction endonuclease S subunit
VAAGGEEMSCDFPLVQLKKIMVPIERPEIPIPGKNYRQLGVKLWGEGAYERESIDGGQTKYKTLSSVQEKDIVVNKIWARNGTVAVVPEGLSGCFVSGEFPTFNPIQDKLEPRWFHWLTKTKGFWRQCDEKTQGTSGKNRIRPEKFLEIEIPLPPFAEQRRIVARIEELATLIEEARGLRRRAVEETDVLLYSAARKLRRKLLETEAVKPVGEITVVTSGGTPDRSNPLYWNNGTIPWIKTGELFDGPIKCSQERITVAGLNNSSAKIFPVDTVLIALYGQGQTRGRTGILKIPATTNQACAAILPQPEIFDSLYLQPLTPIEWGIQNININPLASSLNNKII